MKFGGVPSPSTSPGTYFLCPETRSDELTLVDAAEQAVAHWRGFAPQVNAGVGRTTSRLRLHYANEVQTLARAIELGVQKFFWFPTEVPGEPKHSNVPNPLVHSFQPTLHRLNSMLVDINATAEIVADGDSHFGSVLDRSFEIASGKSEIDPEVLQEFGELRFDRISSYRREDSNANIMIQCADLAAGMARQVSTARISSSLSGGRVVDAWRPYSLCGERANAGFSMLSRRYEQMSLLGPV